MQSLVEEGVSKRVMHAGRGDVPAFVYGTKVFFHYLSKLNDGTVLDDSKKSNKPMELVIGKKFKMEVWEKCVKTMRVSEVAEFAASRVHCGAYPVVAKTLRDLHHGNHKSRPVVGHCCAGSLLQSPDGLGYEDLNSLMKEPQPLTFVLELLSVSQPDDYEKDIWQLDETEQNVAIPRLRERGNELFRDKNFEEASKKYGEALSILENCSLREKPQSPEWEEIELKKQPLLLNFAQSHLMLGNYRLVIEHTSTILERNRDNVKALYRRGKAYGFTWEMELAREDLNRVKQVDPSLGGLVAKDLHFFETRLRLKEKEQKDDFAGKLL